MKAVHFSESSNDVTAEQRAEPRLLCATLVEMTRRDRSRRQARQVVHLEDISTSGACVSSERPLPNRTPVVIRYADGELPGVVRHTRYQDGSYFAGIRFSFGCKWTPECFAPEHLLDPSAPQRR